MKALPNILTSLRLVLTLFVFVALAAASGAVPYVSERLTVEAQFALQRWAFWSFVIAAVTDFDDGWLARKLDAVTVWGAILDPIADKVLVAVVLLVLCGDQILLGGHVWAAIIILAREVLVSGLREYLMELRVSVPVTQIAKWKTTVQLVAVGFLIAGPAGDAVVEGVTKVGIVGLWIAAGLTLYTGVDYFRAGIRHVVDE